MADLYLTAVDTLFFKDGKPFSMGEETWANGIFPPFPTVFYGALRSIWFAEDLDNNFKEPNVPFKDCSLRLEIKGLLPAIDKAPVFPIPCDLYKPKHDKKDEAFKLGYEKRPPSGFISDYEFDGLLKTNGSEKIEELGGKALLSKEEFENYLSGKGSSFPFYWLSKYVLDEPKVGIGRNQQTHTTAQSQLYRVAMKRLHAEVRNKKDKSSEFGFLLSYEGITLTSPVSGLSRFGAEIKAIEYCNDAFPDDVKNPVVPTDKFFKIYLATPAVFDDGFYPKQWFVDNGLTLLTAAIGRVQHIGGFDMQIVKPKPMRKAVPSGTVYYVEITNDEKAETIIELLRNDSENPLHGGNIYQLDPNGASNPYRKQGFGLCYLGKFNPNHITP